MGDFERVAGVDEIKSGSYKLVGVGGREVAVLNLDGKFHAFENVCPHMGGPVGEGIIENGVVTCPLHGWNFDITTGESRNMPGQKLNTFEVKVAGQDVLVRVE